VPFLAHAPMEPMNCVVQLSPGKCDVWNGEQLQTGSQAALAQFLGIKPEDVRINMLLAGGSFGRRGNFSGEYHVEAAAIAKAAGLSVPLKLVRTREDDMRAGYYRPMYVHSLVAGLDENNRIVAWRHRVVGQSLAKGTSLEMMMVRKGIDSSSVEGAANLPYDIPNIRIEYTETDPGIPFGFWRSVGASVTGFVVEGFIDELAATAGEDPFEFRRKRLSKHPRHKAVLELVAEKSGWGKPLPQGRVRGIALMECFGSIVGQVAEVSVTNGNVKIHKMWCAVDAGWVVNPDTIKAQMEGGTLYGVSAALNGEITIQNGRVVQRHFNDYKVVRMNEAPEVETHIVASAEEPGGIGEPSTAVAAGALVNAIAAATGKRIYKLPIRAEQLRGTATARA